MLLAIVHYLRKNKYFCTSKLKISVKNSYFVHLPHRTSYILKTYINTCLKT